MTSLKSRAANVANAVLRPVDVAIVRRSTLPARSHADLLAQIQLHGINPTTAFDIGAARGEWTRACHSIFPNVRFVMVEPLGEFASGLVALAGQLPRAVVIEAAAAEGGGSASLNVHADLVGSSLLGEAEGVGTDGVARSVRTVAIDDLAAEVEAEPPFIIKVDTQGAELRVLDGARQTLAHTDLVVLEVSLIPFFYGGPVLLDVIKYMEPLGFVVYDILGLTYRPLDGALAQVDIAFVPERSPLRNDHRYATAEQRNEQDERFRRSHGAD
jgi:FkbM family methyltransferase